MESPAAVGLDRERTRVLARIERARDRLVDRMVAAIIGGIPLYQSHPDEALMRDLRDHVAANIDLFLLTAKADRVPNASELGFIRQAVEARIAQGFPIDHVLHAFRIGQRVLWETIMSEARSQGAGAEAALSLALPAMQYTDAASSEFTERYVRLEQEMRASAERASGEVVSSLSEGRWPHDRSLAALQAPFPLDVEQAYIVAIVLGSAEDRMDEARRRATPLGTSSPFEGCVAQVSGRELIVILAVREHCLELAHAVLAAKLRAVCERAVSRGRIGIGCIATGIAEIAASRHEAAIASRQAEAGESVVVPALSLVERAALATSGLGAPERLVPKRLREFVSSDLARDATLISTAETYVECDLNTGSTANLLYLHPNTVRYRLGRIGKLAGVDVRSPSEMFELVLAVRIIRAARRLSSPAG
jgi:hypothetical protein